jgi:hypothetical protein
MLVTHDPRAQPQKQKASLTGRLGQFDAFVRHGLSNVLDLHVVRFPRG